MNQRFNLKFDEMKENDPTADGLSEEAGYGLDDMNYATVSHNRTICFVWPDGRQQALNYSYLVSAEYDPVASSISLLFTTHNVVIKGIRLVSLFDHILAGITRKVVAIDHRYAALENDVVTDIQIGAL